MIIAAVFVGNAPVLFAGTAAAAVGFGSGFRGGMQLVLPAAGPDERAGTLSLLYIVCYLGFGVPAVVAGVVDASTGNLKATTLGYAGFLMVLALSAAAALHRTAAAAVAETAPLRA